MEVFNVSIEYKTDRTVEGLYVKYVSWIEMSCSIFSNRIHLINYLTYSIQQPTLFPVNSKIIDNSLITSAELYETQNKTKASNDVISIQ